MASGNRDPDARTSADDECDGDVEEDPFVLFTEWASEADERAYAELTLTPPPPR